MKKQQAIEGEVERKQKVTKAIIEVLSRKMISIDGTELDSYVYSFKNIEERLSKFNRCIEILQLKYSEENELLNELRNLERGISCARHEYDKIYRLIIDVISDERYLINDNEPFNDSEKLSLISKIFFI